MLVWIPRTPFDQIRAPRHLKDFQRSWFDELNMEALSNRDMQGYLTVTPDLWRIAGAHCREYWHQHSSAVMACFNRATMGEREVIFYPPLIELLRTQLAKIHKENTQSFHSPENLQYSLFSKGLPESSGRGGGGPLSSTASAFVFDSDFQNKKLHAREPSPPQAPRRSHGYTQDDFDARDLRKLSDAIKECEQVLSMQPHLSERDILELACLRTGLPLKRALELQRSQRHQSKAFAAAGD